MIFEFGVSVTRKVDLGYGPYMDYLREISPRQPAFGTRENATIELSLWAKSTLEEGENFEEKSQALIEQVKTILDEQLPIHASEDAEMFSITETNVVLPGDKEW